MVPYPSIILSNCRLLASACFEKALLCVSLWSYFEGWTITRVKSPLTIVVTHSQPKGYAAFGPARGLMFTLFLILSPRVDGHAFSVIAAHDAPISVGFAAYNDDVDRVLGKDGDQFIIGGF